MRVDRNRKPLRERRSVKGMRKPLVGGVKTDTGDCSHIMWSPYVPRPIIGGKISLRPKFALAVTIERGRERCVFLPPKGKVWTLLARSFLRLLSRKLLGPGMTEMSEGVTDLVFPHPVHLCSAPSSTAARGTEEIAGLLSGVVVGLAQRGGGAVTANLVVDGVKKVGFLRALLPTLYPLKEREREGREHYQHSSHFFPPPLLSGAERGFGLLLLRHDRAKAAPWHTRGWG